jgi:sugar/nucleoside kinase (ribokinase family)
MQKIDLLTIGDCSIDLFMKVPDRAAGITQVGIDGVQTMCFSHGSKIMVDGFQSSIAGNAINVAVGTKMLGLNVAVYSETGGDANADKIEYRLKKEGVDTKFLIKNQGTETALHAVIVFAGERTIFSYHGKRNYKIQKWDKPKFIYYTSLGEGFEQFQKELVEYLKKNSDIGVIFNPGTFQMANVDALKDILEVCDILILNKEEALRITNSSLPTFGMKNDLKDEIHDLHRKLQKMGPKLTAITDGERGATACDGNKMYSEAIYDEKRPVVDKTGAGDAFSAGFVAAIIHGKKLEEALKWGTINSACQIKVVGSVEGMLTLREMEIRL